MANTNTFVCDLGYMDYQRAWRIQKTLVEKKANGSLKEDYVLTVEHPHVFTVGRKGNLENIFERDVPVYMVERGGDVTYHGPGQQVVYPIIDLTRIQLSVRGYLRALETIVVDALSDFGLSAHTIEGKTGVWIGEKKIASIGVAVDRWITYHGLALNVNTDMSYFFKIRPCGMPSEIMTSMEKMLGHRVDLEAVRRSILESYSKNMGVTFIPVDKVELERGVVEVVG